MKITLSTATAAAALAIAALGTTAIPSRPALASVPAAGHAASEREAAHLVGSVNLASVALHPRAGIAQPVRYTIEFDHHNLAAQLHPSAALGGANAPGATVAAGGSSSADGFNGINILEMEKAGTGKYAGSQFGLEPPDQALCVGNGFVMEGVNTAWRVYSTTGVPLTDAVPLTQFFQIAPAGGPGGASFVSDPRCEYDPDTGRFFALMLEADEASGTTQLPFTRSHTYFAVSKTGDPTGDWNIYSVDVTYDGMQGTTQHTSCPCIDDQPLMGMDKYGFYLSGNQFSDSEIFPVSVPGQVFTVLGTLPDYRSGQAQVYAMSKQALVNGTTPDVLRFDTGDGNYPVPAQDQGQSPASIWSSIQPASPPPGDSTPEPAAGVEYLMSQLDFQGNGDNRIAVWALTNTASLGSSSPNVTLQNDIITTLNPADTYKGPFFGVDQKAGPHPLGDQCGCPEEQLAANDDRMNKPMFTNGILWAGLNTELPPINAGAGDQTADKRAGIMYFAVKPSVDASGKLAATMQRDGYVQVPGENVLFPSIAASPRGPVAMFFTLTGLDYFPSAAWTRLDGLQPGEGPVVHVSGKGFAPEDGFTGYPTGNQLGVPFDTPDSNGVSRWGDYTYAAVDEHGCLWGASEYIPNEARDSNAGDWGTFITRVQPTGCSEPPMYSGPLFHINPCGPLFTDDTGDDVFGSGLAPVATTQGQNPQMDIVSGALRFSPDGKTLSTILTINNLSTTLPAGGQGNNYYFYWQYGGHTWYTLASVDPTGAVSYVDGTDDGGRSARSTGPADTGSFNTGPNGTVVVTVPVDQIGNVHIGSLLQGINAETREIEGEALVIQYDAAGPKFDYLVGAKCSQQTSVFSTTSGGLTQHGGTAGNHITALPNTAPATGRYGSALSLAGFALLLGVRAAARRRRRTAAAV